MVTATGVLSNTTFDHEAPGDRAPDSMLEQKGQMCTLRISTIILTVFCSLGSTAAKYQCCDTITG